MLDTGLWLDKNGNNIRKYQKELLYGVINIVN